MLPFKQGVKFMAANITIAVRTNPYGVPFVWDNGRKAIHITATGSATADNDTGTLTVTQMSNPQSANVPGCSAAFSGGVLTLTSECSLGNGVFHGIVFSTPGDV